ncbi:C25 family cysteine peptidase [Hymenobacter sp. BRD67]|uniref:putative type IX secretion system sortase PorU2 n=1 Tax=Hymenobacter sp. BRD67 TaxID=2675877 RepID=UPI001566B242|nr:C25 family cysteine peptidase [Hymenobacter sp. BRD67]QKG51976.1 hypothetical protein GKZ67_04320 [Hymenobacter sp. BRD67]
MLVAGASVPSHANGYHTTSLGVLQPGTTTVRSLSILSYPNFSAARARYTLQRSDISSAGVVQINGSVLNQGTGPVYDAFRYGYLRLTAPQENRWFSDRRSLWFQNDSLLGGPATYEIDNIPATVNGYDIQDPWNVQRIAPTAAQTLGSTARRFVFPDATAASTRQLLLADGAQPLVPPAPQPVHFRTINPAKPNFIIITHPKLMKAAGSEPNAARAYANYRASAAGGGYDTLMVTAPLLYDQFHYGERSLMGLRHFALWLAANSPTRTQYLLLLGKALAPDTRADNPGDPIPTTTLGAFTASTTRILGDLGQDLVPTSSRASSDNILSSDWQHDNYVPRLPTGRVAATTPQDVMAYLNKLKEHEALGPEDWRKNVVHLVGGANASDFAEFAGYLNIYKQQIQRPLFGGTVTTYQKSGILPTSINISDQVNNGLSLISYFGHGSINSVDLNIGNINDPVSNYHNAGRYPVMMYDGCEVGQCFVVASTFGNDWMLAPSKGAVGLLSQTDLSFAYLLHPAQQKLHELLFNNPTWFGRPVAEVRAEVVRQLQNLSPFLQNPAGAVDLLATLWQGDPALRLYAPAAPDFIANGITISPNPVAATASSFQLIVSVSNPGRITFDPIEIRVTRTYSAQNGRKPDTFFATVRQAWQRDTTYTITIPNSGNVFGDNKFLVELDYQNKVAELNENNNSASLIYTFLEGGVTLLTPTEFAIVPTTTPAWLPKAATWRVPRGATTFRSTR